MEAASYFLEYLRPVRSFGDPELQFEISLLEIDLLVKQEDYETALQTVNKHIAALKRKTGAGKLFQRLRLLRSVELCCAHTS
jgi:anaphase-promoting complex subunit 5